MYVYKWKQYFYDCAAQKTIAYKMRWCKVLTLSLAVATSQIKIFLASTQFRLFS